MNKQRRGDYGNDAQKSQASITAKPHDPKGQSVEGLRPGYVCKPSTPKAASHPFKSQVRKAQPSSKKIPGVPGVKGE